MEHELHRVSDALLAELGARVVQLLFYENEGMPLWVGWPREDVE